MSNIYDKVRYEEPFSSYTKESLNKRIAKEYHIFLLVDKVIRQYEEV